MYVPDVVFNTVRDALRPQPYLRFTSSPEVVVLVEPEENVFLVPAEGQSTAVLGVQADRGGRAWFKLKEGGRYRALVVRDGGFYEAMVVPEPPGEWYQVKEVRLSS